MQKLAPVLTGASLLRYRSRESVNHLWFGFPQGALNRKNNQNNSEEYVKLNSQPR